MKRPGILLLVVLPLTLSLTGCFTARKDNRRYYTLPTAAAVNRKPVLAWAGAVQVPVFQASAVHDRVGMVLRRSDVELKYSARDLWASRPQHLISSAAMGALIQARLFDGVVRDLGTRSPKWVLRGRVTAFEVITGAHGEGPWRVRLALQMTLRDFRTSAVLWQRSWRKTGAARSATPAAAARALGKLVNGALADMQRDLARIAPSSASATKKAGK
ncbi:MAG: membrane integrity-associated transporter subunit PqiC [Myxococcales bacterium]|nr:membrane integrity-associated transporter subunit PqiC [Myxococcales bacterium]